MSDSDLLDWCDRYFVCIQYSGDNLERCEVRGWDETGLHRGIHGTGLSIREAIKAAMGTYK